MRFLHAYIQYMCKKIWYTWVSLCWFFCLFIYLFFSPLIHWFSKKEWFFKLGVGCAQVVEWWSDNWKVVGFILGTCSVCVEVSLNKKPNPNLLLMLCHWCWVHGYPFLLAGGTLQGDHCYECLTVCVNGWILTCCKLIWAVQPMYFETAADSVC